MPKRKHPDILVIKNGRQMINGEFVFFMQDTYGIPHEIMIEEINRRLEKNYSVS